VSTGNLVLNEWETAFFGRQIYSLSPPLDSVVQTHAIHNALVSIKLNSDDAMSLDFVRKSGFSFVEGEITYSKSLSSCESRFDLVSYHLADDSLLDDLKKMVTGLYINSRFKEPWFSENERDDFYRCWLRNAILAKFDDCCLVIKTNEDISGFVTLRIRQEEATIGLIGVAPSYHGKGIGKKLIETVEAYCARRGVNSISVSTQKSNIAATNLYIKTGFSTTEKSYWFYKQV